jgi:DNA-binding CsgD family transcriptional regulator
VSYSSLLNALSQIRDVVLIVTRDRMILYSNDAADQLLAEGKPLLVERGRLEASSALVGQQLGRAIDSTCADRARSVLLLRRASAPPLIVAVNCLDDDAENILLVARDSTLHPRPTATALRTCFGLTRSEAEVAAAIAAGESCGQIAERRGVSTNTIRTQLKTISAKLGCAGQAQISAIVHAVPIATD